MSTTGLLIDRDEAKNLSQRLYQLGDQIGDICAEIEQAGYGAPASAIREGLAALAATNDRVQQLWLYWSEYAKERLASLVGPMNVLAGNLPDIAAYRSPFLAELRVRAVAGQFQSSGPIASPQIEPTMKRYVEMMPDDPFVMQVNSDVKEARRQATTKLSLAERPGFDALNAKAKYELLIERYLAALEPAGFKLDSHRKSGLVFRKITSDHRWAFLFVDDSRDGIDGGMLSVRFAITLPKKAVLPSALSLSVVATFSPDDIVPGFGAVRGFARGSYAEFCLAADACAFLTRALCVRVDALLSCPEV